MQSKDLALVRDDWVTNDDESGATIGTMRRPLFVYIMTNRSGSLYIGVTSNLQVRIDHHRNSTAAHFTGRYRLTRLVYVEEFHDYNDAIRREKQLKGWTRRKKFVLIESMNPHWKDLMGEE